MAFEIIESSGIEQCIDKTPRAFLTLLYALLFCLAGNSLPVVELHLMLVLQRAHGPDVVEPDVVLIDHSDLRIDCLDQGIVVNESTSLSNCLIRSYPRGLYWAAFSGSNGFEK